MTTHYPLPIIHYFAYLGLSAIVAEIPNLDQFRWSGYFVAIHSVVLAVVTLVFFRERRRDLRRGGGISVTGRLSVPLYVSFHSPEAFHYGGYVKLNPIQPIIIIIVNTPTRGVEGRGDTVSYNKIKSLNWHSVCKLLPGRLTLTLAVA